ncbi:MAG: tetratricopeptide repeat protein [Elusimicrobia bacterium]|nr:tetratricopeptide repeat protein [Elusimicrobiota bacterium]
MIRKIGKYFLWAGGILLIILAILTGWLLLTQKKWKSDQEVKLGEQYYLQKDYVRAVVAYFLAVKLNPKNATAQAGLALSYSEFGLSLANNPDPLEVRKKYFLKARQHIQEALKLDPNNAHNYYLSGHILGNEGYVIEAEPDLSRAAQLAPSATDYQRVLQITLKEKIRLEQLRTQALTATGGREDEAAFHLKFGELLADNYPLRALEEYEKASQLKPDWPAVDLKIGRLYLAYQSWEKASVFCKQATTAARKEGKAAPPDFQQHGLAEACFCEGKAYFEIFLSSREGTAENFNNAEYALKRNLSLVQDDPKLSADGHYWLGKLYLAKNLANQAIQEFSLAMASDPAGNKNAAIHTALGYAYFNKGSYQYAEKELLKAKELNPQLNESCSFILILAKAEMSPEKLQQAKKDFEKARDCADFPGVSFSENPKFFINKKLFVINRELGLLDQAIESGKQALIGAPTDYVSGLKTDIGTLYQQKGDQNEAIKNYQAVLAKNPNYCLARSKLAVIYHDQGIAEQAMPEYEKCVSACSQDERFSYVEAVCRENLTSLYQEKNLPDKAKIVLNILRQKKRLKYLSDVNSYKLAAETIGAKEGKQKAIDTLKEGIQLYPDIQIELGLELLKYDSRQGVQALENILSHPNGKIDPSWHSVISVAYAHSGNHDKSRYYENLSKRGQAAVYHHLYRARAFYVIGDLDKSLEELNNSKACNAKTKDRKLDKLIAKNLEAVAVKKQGKKEKQEARFFAPVEGAAGVQAYSRDSWFSQFTQADKDFLFPSQVYAYKMRQKIISLTKNDLERLFKKRLELLIGVADSSPQGLFFPGTNVKRSGLKSPLINIFCPKENQEICKQYRRELEERIVKVATLEAIFDAETFEGKRLYSYRKIEITPEGREALLEAQEFYGSLPALQ